MSYDLKKETDKLMDKPHTNNSKYYNYFEYFLLLKMSTF